MAPDEASPPPPQTWERLFREESANLTRLAARRLGDHQMAEDVVQDTYLRLLEGRVPVRHPRAYLYQTARNQAINQGISQARRQRRRLALDISELPDLEDRTAAPAVTYCEARDMASALTQAISAMPHKQRRAFVLHRFTAADYRDIAGDIAVSVSMVEKYVMDALKTCRAALREHLDTAQTSL